MDRVTAPAPPAATSPADRLVRRQRAAHATHARLHAELVALTLGHPVYPALRAAVRRADRHWHALIDEDAEADALATLAALGLSPCDLSPWGA